MRPAQLRADEIDSRTLCVSVDARRVDAITDAVRSFHERLSPDAFVERQAARVRSDGFLSPLGLVRTLAPLWQSPSSDCTCWAVAGRLTGLISLKCLLKSAGVRSCIRAKCDESLALLQVLSPLR